MSFRAFNDASCSKCSKRYGWVGKLSDQPCCPRCGNKPDLEAIAHNQKIMDDFRDTLIKRKERHDDDDPDDAYSNDDSGLPAAPRKPPIS